MLRLAGQAIRLLGCATPANLESELSRLRLRYAAGERVVPAFRYPSPPAQAELRDGLALLADRIEAHAEGASEPARALGALYAGRARELRLESAIGEAVGTPTFRAYAARRYARRDGHDDEADDLARRWLAAPPDSDSTPAVRSDDRQDTCSLWRRMSEEASRQGLAVRVVVSEHLSALAATGPGVIYVARGRLLSVEDVERTVLHEIHGHAAPRQRALAMPLGIFEVGSAHGSDEQEGRALYLEHRAGWLERGRRFELGLRHVAARSVRDGADFPETVTLLLEHGTDPTGALRVAARVHRGGGLARELVYLPAFLRVSEAVARDPRVDETLAHGRITVQAATTLLRHGLGPDTAASLTVR